MALSAGARLGPYQIVAPLGAGGMGEVYRARDARLNRDVAIKVLLPEVAGDPDRLARFSREAQVLASLNHPNVAHVYGLEGRDAIVMELVEGPTLADRIAQGRFRSKTRCRSRNRSQKRSKPRTKKGSSTAI
jgi:serine/threonine protein kinase